MSRQSLAVKSSGALTGTWPVGDHLAVDLHGDVERAAGLGHGVGRLDLDLHLARGELLLGADLRALDDEEVVLVAEHAVLHVAGEAAGVRAQRVEHAVGVGRDIGVDGDEVGLVAEGRRAELRHADDVAGEGPLRVGRRDPQLGVQHGNPEAAADGQRLFFAASMRKISFICASFSGILAARSLAWVQSSSRL